MPPTGLQPGDDELPAAMAKAGAAKASEDAASAARAARPKAPPAPKRAPATPDDPSGYAEGDDNGGKAPPVKTAPTPAPGKAWKSAGEKFKAEREKMKQAQAKIGK